MQSTRWRRWGWVWVWAWAVTACVAEPEPLVDDDPADGALGADVGGWADGGAGDARPPKDMRPDSTPVADRGPPVVDGQPGDGALPVDGGTPDGGPVDRGPGLDARPEDAAVPDLGRDVGVALDAAAEDAAWPDASAEDAAPADAVPPDAALDEGIAQDAALPDMALDEGVAVDAAVPTAFLVGQARAMDGRTPVTVRGGGAEAVTDAEGRYRLGPLFGGPVTLRFSAAGHQAETLDQVAPDDGEAPVEVLMELYRGQRIGTGAGRIDFDFGDGYVVWNVGDRLVARPTAGGDAVELLAEGYEVFLGFQPGDGAAVVRVRTQPGIAGDIYRVPLDGAEPVRLFVEAQPWVRWLGDGRALGMVHTRDALSRLEVVVPGGPAQAVAEGVPWLLVSTLLDGQVAFAAGEGPGFGVYLTALEGGEPIRVDDGGPTSDAFLSTTPGRSGLLWLTPDAVLWRWEPDTGAVPLADGVLASPRPQFLPDGRLLFWRADGGRPEEALWILEEADERLLVDHADGGTLTTLGAGVFVVRPEQGLWWQPYDADGDLAVEAPITSYRVSAGGALALSDGVVWRYRPDLEATAIRGLGPLSVLSNTVAGATAWEAGTQTLWWIPQPGLDRPAVSLAEGALAPAARNAVGGTAAFVRGGEGWAWVPLPPGDDDREAVAYGPEVDRLVDVISAEEMLTQDAAGTLYRVDVTTGAATGWAREVGLVRRSGRGGFVAYTCDRGLFLVPMGE
ncbi:MAG: carboxypeptidase regulatory-like domain-containing protein [Myxococcales bacterium]|nr:carboxypeptidase regulatory-like domain-containing protein [Myxococcales bacterium]